MFVINRIMKKLLLFGGVGAVVLVVIIFNLLFKTDTSQDEVLSKSLSDTSSTVLLQPLAADVSVFDVGLSNWRLVVAETPLLDGAQIKTSATGRALLTRGTEIVTSINSNTEMTLSLSEDEKKNILKLVAGQTWTKITRALEQDEVYEVHTPTMVAAVRGTSFGVSTIPPQVTVTEGTVWATAIDPETGLPDPKTTVVVKAGFTVSQEDGELKVREIVVTDKDAWYFEHNPEPESEPGDDSGNPEENLLNNEEVVTEEDVAEVVSPTIAPVLPNTTINSVSPVSFDLAVEDRLLIRGEHLDLVERVVIDGKDREFTLTSAGVLVVEKSELPTKAGEYGVTLFYRDTSVSKARAFSIVEPKPVGIVISAVVAGVTNSPEDYVEVRGSGFSLVTTVLVNGRSNPFQSIGDNMIHIFDFSMANVRSVELQGSGQKATFTL